MVSTSVSGVGILGLLIATCSAQCVQNVQPSLRGNLNYRPSWEILPMWSDSQFYDLLSVFDDPWFNEFRENSQRGLEDWTDRTHHHQQDAADYNKQRDHTISRDQCGRRINRQSHEERQRLQMLANLDGEETDLQDQQKKHMELFKQKQEEFERKQKEINQKREEARLGSTDRSSGEKFLSKEEQEFQEMKEWRQRMAEEKQRQREEIEAAKIRETRMSQLEEQRQQAALREQHSRARLQEEQRQAELQEQRQAELQEQRQAELQEQRQAELQARRQAELREQRQAELQEQHRREERAKAMRHEQNRLGDRQKLNVRDIAKHQVTGFDPDDINLRVTKGQIKVNGKHICHCNENCISREFAHSFPLPAGIDASSVTATMDVNGNIRMQGVQSRQQHVDMSPEITVKVQGLGIPQSTKPSAEEMRRCLSKKGGIKLHKINKNTGRVHIDEEFKYQHEAEPSVADTDAYDHGESYIEIEDYDV